jgi:hypothetical protein
LYGYALASVALLVELASLQTAFITLDIAIKTTNRYGWHFSLQRLHAMAFGCPWIPLFTTLVLCFRTPGDDSAGSQTVQVTNLRHPGVNSPTSRRVNALENVVTPRLENTVSYIKGELDELEVRVVTHSRGVSDWLPAVIHWCVLPTRPTMSTLGLSLPGVSRWITLGLSLPDVTRWITRTMPAVINCTAVFYCKMT